MLLLAIFFLFVLFLLAVAFVVLIPTELSAALQERLWMESSYAADAGMQEATAMLEWQLSHGVEPVAAGLDSVTVDGALGEWTYRVTITPDASTPPNGTNSLRVYRLESVASLFGRARRAARAMIRQDSFARFSSFWDKREDESGNVLYLGSAIQDGPVHSNGQIRLVLPMTWFADPSKAAFFLANVSQAYSDPNKPGDSIMYVSFDAQEHAEVRPYDEHGNPIPGRYEKLLKDGRPALTTGVRPIEMPADHGGIRNAAWGSGDSPPSAATPPGVFVNSQAGKVSGGIYVHGDSDEVKMEVVDGNFRVNVKQGAKTVVITEVNNPISLPPGSIVNGTPQSAGMPVPEGSTVVARDDQFEVLSGSTNGVIFSSGTINSFSGTYKGRRTVEADVAADKDVVIGGDLLRLDTTRGEKPTEGSTDTLGVVGKNVRIGKTAPRDLYLYGVFYAGKKDANGESSGSFKVDEYKTRWPPGMMYIFGGVIKARAGVEEGYDDKGRAAGYSSKKVYDPSLATAPPPFFPTYSKFRLTCYEETNP
ncbi:MAG: hypothetical protein FJX76_13655 [Armatimonadetes bacterium]|nr:hypothetical protein [Armatimonadota bacterium]